MIEDVSHWHWFIFAAVLVIIELLTGGAYFLMMGVAAALIAAALFVAPKLGFAYQLMGFAVLSIVAILVGQRYFKKNPIPTDQPTLNRRGEQYVGRTFTLETPIVNGVGKLRVDDTTWRIEGPNMAAGVQVKVVGVDGTNLKVAVMESETA